MPISATNFKKLSAADKRAKIMGDDVWPFESLAKGKDDELLVAVVHRPSAETVQSVVLSDQLQNCLAYFWYFFTGEGSDVQRTYIQERTGGKQLWSIHTMLVDVDKQLKELTTLDQVGAWQAKIISFVDDVELQAALSALPIDEFLSTLDGSVVKLTPVTDVIRLWYATCMKLAADLGKSLAFDLSTDSSGEKGMGKVLRPCPLAQNNMATYLRTLRKKDLRQLRLSEVLESDNGRSGVSWKSVLKATGSENKESDKSIAEHIQGLTSIPNKLAVQRAVRSLQILMGKKIDRQYEALLSRVQDSKGLQQIFAKFWAKRTPAEQAEVEEDLQQWLTAVKDQWGDGDVVLGRKDTLDRVEKVMSRFVEAQAGDGKDLDWSELAMSASLELTCRDDEEFSALMDALIGFQDVKVAKGSEEQEVEFRKLLVRIVNKASKDDRRKDIATAFEAAVGGVADSKRATKGFLSHRTGATVGTVVLASGSVKVAAADARMVVRLQWLVSNKATTEMVEAFAAKLMDVDIAIGEATERSAWDLIRVPRSQVTKLLGNSDDRSFVSDDQCVEINVSQKRDGGVPWQLEAGHCTDLARAKANVVRKRPGGSPAEPVKRVKREPEAIRGPLRDRNHYTGFSPRYDSRDRPRDHVSVRLGPSAGGKGKGKGRGRF